MPRVVKFSLVLLSVACVLYTCTCEVALDEGSSKCNFQQLLDFINRSLCYKEIYQQVLEPPIISINKSVLEDYASQYCRQDCVGNLLKFLQDRWDCKKVYKELYSNILASLCSRNEDGKRCIHMISASSGGVSSSNSTCSKEYVSHTQGIVDKCGCCFRFIYGTRVSLESLGICNIQVPSQCTPDYEKVDKNMPRIGNISAAETISSYSSLFVLTILSLVLIHFC